jgi:hypothetical protein
MVGDDGLEDHTWGHPGDRGVPVSLSSGSD